MSSKGFKRPWIAGNGRKILTFQILPNGTGTPTIGDNPDGVVASVSRSGVGVIVVTLNDTFLDLASIQITPQLSAAAATLVVVTGATTEATTKQITVTTMQESAGTFAAADIAANAANILHFTCVMKDSGGQ